MGISEHPPTGTILIADFSGLIEPEMVKPRPVVVISPKIATRGKLCTVISLSTTEPNPIMPYHYSIRIDPKLPAPWDKESMWVKGDMIYALGFHRLDFPRMGKDKNGKTIYRFGYLDNAQMKEVRACLLRSIGLSVLTKYL